MVDVIEKRILGAVRFLDRAAGFMLERPVDITSEQVEFVRNRSNHYVVTRAPGFDTYVESFRPMPTTPAPLSVLVTAEVNDPLREYLPRRFSMRLPRDPDPANASAPGSAFRAVGANHLFPLGTHHLGHDDNAVVVLYGRSGRASDSHVAGRTLKNRHPGPGDLLRVDPVLQTACGRIPLHLGKNFGPHALRYPAELHQGGAAHRFKNVLAIRTY